MDKKVICSRCGKECTEGNAYYTIYIYGNDITPTKDGRMSIDAASQNIVTNIVRATNTERHYCKQCKNDIDKFMNTPPNSAAQVSEQTKADNMSWAQRSDTFNEAVKPSDADKSFWDFIKKINDNKF